MTAVTVQQLVDQVLDTAQAAHPGVEFGITLSLANALLLQKDSDKLWRKDAEQAVTYYGDLRTGAIATTLPDDVQTEPPAQPA